MRLIDAEILRDRLYKTRNAALADGRNKAYGKGIRDAIEIVEQQPTVEPGLLKEQEEVTGETSDGYHTFNELYHHRAVLFSVIVANYPDRAWKSKKHHDGTMYDGMFIVGIETPDGQATYHYNIDPYWDMFKCRVLNNAPEWDGHTPAQAIERIGKLKEQEAKEVIKSTNMYTGLPITHCPKCGVSIDRYLHGRQHEGQINCCPFCGQAVKWE